MLPPEISSRARSADSSSPRSLTVADVVGSSEHQSAPDHESRAHGPAGRLLDIPVRIVVIPVVEDLYDQVLGARNHHVATRSGLLYAAPYLDRLILGGARPQADRYHLDGLSRVPRIDAQLEDPEPQLPAPADIAGYPDLEFEIYLSDRELNVLVLPFFNRLGEFLAQRCDPFDQADLSHLALPQPVTRPGPIIVYGFAVVSAAYLYAPRRVR